MMMLVDGTINASLIIIAALAGARVLRASSAALRHWLLAVAVACALVVPVLSLMVPAWSVRSADAEGPQPTASALTTRPAGSARLSSSGESSTSVQAEVALRASAGANPARATQIRRVLEGLWLTGVGLSLVSLVSGLVRLRRAGGAARPVECVRWSRLAREACGELGLRRRVALLESDHPTLPITWGMVRPRIALPSSALDWPDDRARIVLRHELAHIARRDWAVQMAAEVLRSLYWFNPLVWLACRRLRVESERACDDAVLASGVASTEYAATLLGIARTLTDERDAWLPAPAMVRSTSLEGRIRAMLRNDVSRRPPTASARLAVAIALLGLTLPLAGLAAQSTFYTFSGSVMDSTNGALPDTVMVLTNASRQAKYEVRSDASGRFEFVGLPNGEYDIETRLAGFAPYRDTVIIAGRNLDRRLELQVGSLQETITVRTATAARGDRAAAQTPEERQRTAERVARGRSRVQRALETCAAGVGTGVATPVGGNILPPMKLVDVRPIYPDHLKEAKVGGTVTMEAVIGAVGDVVDVREATSSHPDLTAAAIDAVRQWQFTATLLNCTPIEVKMNVTTTFAPEP